MMITKYKERMNQINKPFYNALHYPALMPYQKAVEYPIHCKQPNENLNREVFYRLYDKPILENQAKIAIRNKSPTASISPAHGDQQGVQNHSNSGIKFAENHQEKYASRSPLVRLHPARETPGNSGLPSANPSKSRVGQTSLKSGLFKKTKTTGYGDSSYLVRERARLAMDTNKKFTWEHLEKMNVNELKGLTSINFDPSSLIGFEDDEDRLYIQEYLKHSAVNRVAVERQVKEKKNFEAYGEIKRYEFAGEGESPVKRRLEGAQIGKDKGVVSGGIKIESRYGEVDTNGAGGKAGGNRDNNYRSSDISNMMHDRSRKV